jgi:hypothetical protein
VHKFRGMCVVGVILAAALVVPATATAMRPAFGVGGALEPGFSWGARDYVVRGCEDEQPLRLKVRGARGWRTAINDGAPRSGDRTKQIRATTGETTTVRFGKARKKKSRAFHVRCLPDDFPAYSFSREREGGPKFFSLQLGGRYGAIFDGNGVPIWWIQATGEPDNISVLADGTMTWVPVAQATLQVGDIEIRTLRGRLLHRFGGAPGTVADIHDLLLEPNGNYLLGAQVTYTDDVTAFGGQADSEVIGIEIQEFTPDGDLVDRWASRDQIALEETGRWWDEPILDAEPYDVVHWNSVESSGRYLLISMRHNDAVYKVDRRTGEVVWKLGGTPTPEQLEVLGDPLGDYPLGGQHDARLEPDGSVTIYDNGTNLGRPPRVVRYEIDEAAGTARLVETFEDPDVTDSFCCGSARKLPSDSWLVGWGGVGTTGAYDKKGRRLFRFDLDVGFTYRALPVPKGAVTRGKLRNAMDAMASEARG